MNLNAESVYVMNTFCHVSYDRHGSCHAGACHSDVSTGEQLRDKTGW